MSPQKTEVRPVIPPALTINIYTIAKNVVIPAINSVFIVVPLFKFKKTVHISLLNIYLTISTDFPVSAER